MGKYRSLAEDIVKHVGGKENINGVIHCITRLRFDLKDQTLADDEYLKNLDGVVTVVKNSGQYMVVIGEHVPLVYEDVLGVLGISADEAQNTSDKKSIGQIVLGFITSSIVPTIFLLSASGIIKGILSLLAIFGFISRDSGTYTLFYSIGDAIFLFMPIFIGANTAKYMKMDPLVGSMIGAALCYPALNGTDLIVFGQPINVTYTSTMLPVMITVLFASYVQKFAKKIVPQMVAPFIIPLIIMAIAVPVGYMLIGPFANFIAKIMSDFINGVYNLNSVLGAALLGGLWQILVMFGVHAVVLTAPMVDLIQGIPSEIMSGMFGASFAIMGVVLGVYFKTKNDKLKKIAMPAFISAIFGVTEPAMYGVVVPRPKLLVITSLAAALGGAISGFFHNTTYSLTGLGIFGAIGKIAPDGSGFLGVALQMIVPTIAGAIAAYILYNDKNDPLTTDIATEVVADEASGLNENKLESPITEDYGKLQKEVKIFSPIDGDVRPVSESEDEVFSMGVLGKGVIVIPNEGKVYAPTEGVIKTLFSTKHAIGFLSKYGPEVLIHVGMDTVKLEGKGFKAYVKEGDSVNKGDLLLEFDIDYIKSQGYSVESPVVITNTDDYVDVIEKNLDNATNEDVIITLFR